MGFDPGARIQGQAPFPAAGPRDLPDGQKKTAQNASIRVFGFPTFFSKLGQRVLYRGTAATGKTVFDVEPNGDAAAEFNALRAEILQMMK